MDALIFDLDGTLLDSLADIAGAMNEALQVHGVAPHAEAAYRRFVGEGVQVLVRKALGEHQELHAPVLASYRQLYAARLPGSTHPYPGIRTLIELLRHQDVPLAVLSNKPDAATQALVAHLFPDSPFAVVAGQKQDVPAKPDPQAALQIAALLGVTPDRCGFIGDSAIDMQTAVAAGMTGIGVTWGFRDRIELADAGARAIIERPGALLDLLAATA